MVEDFWKYHLRKAGAFALARKVYEEKIGNDLCTVIERSLYEMPRIIESLAEAGKWKDVRTEVNRLIDYSKLTMLCSEESKNAKTKTTIPSSSSSCEVIAKELVDMSLDINEMLSKFKKKEIDYDTLIVDKEDCERKLLRLLKQIPGACIERNHIGDDKDAKP